MEYLPVDQRTPDSQYQGLMREILDRGVLVSQTRQNEPAIARLGIQMRFDMANGFPVIGERNIGKFWWRAIGELCAFINGARTLKQLAEFGCNWWGDWGTEEKCSKRGLETGDLGPGSYGAAFHDFPTADGGSFDQFKHLVEQIREFPYDRTHLITPWIPQYLTRGKGKQMKATICPCHGWIQVTILNDRLHLHMKQRSGDVPVGVPSNMVQYAALALMLEQLTGFQVAEYIHYIVNAHIYTDQLGHVQTMLDRVPIRFPTVQLNEDGRKVDDIHDFRGEHFELTEYSPHPAIDGIPMSP